MKVGDVDLDAELLDRYPRLDDVVAFIDGNYRTMKGQGHPYRLYERLGVDSTEGFLRLMEFGNEDAIESYQNLRDIFGW